MQNFDTTWVLSAYEGFMQTEFGSARLRDRNFTGQESAKMDEIEPIYLSKIRPRIGKKWKKLNRYISISAATYEKWFVIFEHTINHLSFGYVHLFQLKHYFFKLFFCSHAIYY